MWRILVYPMLAVEWLWKWFHGHCRPHCTGDDLRRRPDLEECPGRRWLVVECQRCGRFIEL